MAIVITGDLDWTGALVLFLEALDGGPAADIAGYAFTSSGDLEYSCSVPEPVLPADRLLGTYRCVAETAGGVIAGVGYCSIAAATTAVRLRSEEASALDSATQATLLEVKAKTDLIGTAAGATTLLDAAVLEPGTITSFPETLTIGDSYTEQNGREIHIPIVDTDGTPLSSTGSLNFADASVTFTLQRSGETDSTRVITGSATFVDPPGTGTGAGAPYAVIELPASETAKGLKKYKYSGILTFTWTGTGTDVMSFETDTVTFDN